MLKVQVTSNENGSFLNLPSIEDQLLPTVTIVTPTYNHYHNFDIAIRNYKSFNYPREKLFWIILDDSPTDSLKDKIPDDKSIRYIYNSHKETVSAKRNRLAAESKTQVICHMDDDDYYYPDSVKIRVIAMIAYKKPVSACMEINCYNIVDDTQFVARGKDELLNVSEATLCYLKDYWNEYKFNDNDNFEESINFLKGNLNNYIDIPCFWVMLSITHKTNIWRRAIAPVLSFSFLETLPVNDFEYIKSQKIKLMEKDPNNAKAIKVLQEIKKSKTPERIIDKQPVSIRKISLLENILIQFHLKVIVLN